MTARSPPEAPSHDPAHGLLRRLQGSVWNVGGRPVGRPELIPREAGRDGHAGTDDDHGGGARIGVLGRARREALGQPGRCDPHREGKAEEDQSASILHGKLLVGSETGYSFRMTARALRFKVGARPARADIAM